MMIEGAPFHGAVLEKMQEFLEKQGLEYDPGIDYSVCVVDSDGNIIGTGSLDGNVIKCVAVDPARRSEGIAGQIITELIACEFERGYSHIFIYTKPENETLFSDMGFSTILKTGEILFMENWKDGFGGFIGNIKRDTPGAAKNPELRIGAVVANCNPFTRGHRYLLERATGACDYLHLFILEDSRSLFSLDERYRMAVGGCSDLKQVTVHKGADYIVSSATFPAYFFKDKEIAKQANCRLDLELFAKRIAPELQIGVRFVGSEPSCQVTGLYNRMMKSVLPAHGILVEEIERLRIEGRPVSASEVRSYIAAGKAEEMRRLTPVSTWPYLEKKIRLSSIAGRG